MKINTLIILLIALNVIACGRIEYTNYNEVTDEAFITYIAKFENIYHLQVNTPIVFAKAKDTNTLGTCRAYRDPSGNAMFLNSNKTIIYIDQTWWDKLTDMSKEQLIFHELGHCVFGYKHKDTMLPSGIPASIMSTYAFSPYIYYENAQYYYEELRP